MLSKQSLIQRSKMSNDKSKILSSSGVAQEYNDQRAQVLRMGTKNVGRLSEFNQAKDSNVSQQTYLVHYLIQVNEGISKSAVK